jgi:HlyD family secretion protein
MQMSFHLIPNAYWKAWVGVNTAGAAYDGAVAALNDLYRMRDNPQELNAQIAAAEAQYRAAASAVDMAQAQLDGLEAGATAEEIAIAEAQVEQSQAALDALAVQRDKQTIAAPVGGVVLEVSIHAGELAAPGGTLLTLGHLDQVTLTVYVPEDRLGQVKIGQRVAVSVDSFPGRTFDGTVVRIAEEAEFTPRNVQTKEERVNMVFAVEVRIPNPDHALKPGVPADAVIMTEEQ